MANVLFIDPNIALTRPYALALQHAGHTVVHAMTGQKAIDTADSQTPDVVVLELQLGAHDGIEFLQEFRSYPEWLAIPVIILSSIPPGTIASVRAALEGDLGVMVCLYKPRTSLQQLLSAVNEQIT